MDVDVHIIKLGLNLSLHWHPCINQLSPVHRPVRVAHLNFCSCTAFWLVVYLVRSKHCSLSALCRKLPLYRGHQQFPWTQHPYAFLIVHVCWLHTQRCFYNIFIILSSNRTCIDCTDKVYIVEGNEELYFYCTGNYKCEHFVKFGVSCCKRFSGNSAKVCTVLKKKCLERVHVSVLKHSKQSGQKEITDPNSRRVIL